MFDLTRIVETRLAVSVRWLEIVAALPRAQSLGADFREL